MGSDMKNLRTNCTFGCLLAAVLVAGPTWALADEGERMTGRGKQLFMDHCASCHGASGEGSGPVAPFLTISPTDLTRISERNDGAFPFLKVFQIIDGRTGVRAHGDTQMPVWGGAFKAEAGDSYGPYGGEEFVRARITALTFYVQSIQD